MIETRDLEALTDAVSEVVNAHIAEIVTALRAEIKETVQRHIESLPPGRPGKDASPVDVEAIAERAASLIKAPKDGKDADPVDTDSIILRVAELIPKPKDGVDGKDGTSGRDGADGKDGLNGRDGVDGKDGIAGRDGTDGTKGSDGADGKDGRSVEPAEVEAIAERLVESRASQWELDFERRAHEQFQRAIDRMPKPTDGRNGFELEDLTISDDGDGLLTVSFKRGELVKSHSFRVYTVDDSGVFEEGRTYRRGNGVSFGGSFWIAQKDAPEGKPGTGSDWRLAVKKGRDGRDGILKQPKPEGPVKL